MLPFSSTPCDEAANQGLHHREGRVGDDPERPTREPEIGGVGLNDDHSFGGEALPQDLGAPRVQLDRHHPGPHLQKGLGEAPEPRTDVDDQLAALHAGVGDQTPRPGTTEPVPPPERPALPGHGGPS